METMKLAVIGTRKPQISYDEFSDMLSEVVDVKRIEVVVSGGEEGVDSFAEKWAQEHSLSLQVFKLEHSTQDKTGHFVRNQKIIEARDKVVALLSKESRGTHLLLDYARKLRKRITIIEL